MKLVKLTDIRGHPVFINPESLVKVRLPLKQEMADGTRTVLDLYGGIQGVQETPDVVVAAIELVEK